MDLQTLESKTAKRPRSPAFARVANEYLKSGSINRAKQICLKGLEIFPSYAVGHVMLAKCLAAEKDYTSALEHLRKAVRFVPDSRALLDLQKEWERALSRGIVSSETSPAAAEEKVAEAAPLHGTTASAPEPRPPVDETPPAPEPMPEIHPAEMSAEPALPAAEPVLPFEPPAAEKGLEPAMAEVNPEITPPEEKGSQGIVDLEARISGSESVESLPDIMEIPFMSYAEAPPMPAGEPPQPEPPPQPAPAEEPEGSGPALPAGTSEPGQAERPEVDYEGRIASKTLAEIYAQQGEFAEAILTLQLLKNRRPELTAEIDDRIRELQDMLSSKSSE